MMKTAHDIVIAPVITEASMAALGPEEIHFPCNEKRKQTGNCQSC